MLPLSLPKIGFLSAQVIYSVLKSSRALCDFVENAQFTRIFSWKYKFYYQTWFSEYMSKIISVARMNSELAHPLGGDYSWKTTAWGVLTEASISDSMVGPSILSETVSSKSCVLI